MQRVISVFTAGSLLLLLAGLCGISPREAQAQSRIVSEKLIGKLHSNVRVIASPDHRRVAYAAGSGNKRVVVVDGKEGKQYNSTSHPIFSTDSKRVAYAATEGNKGFLVVDGKEGKQYDDVISRRLHGGGIVFDSPNRFHYLALKGNGVYLVEETLK